MRFTVKEVSDISFRDGYKNTIPQAIKKNLKDNSSGLRGRYKFIDALPVQKVQTMYKRTAVKSKKNYG